MAETPSQSVPAPPPPPAPLKSVPEIIFAGACEAFTSALVITLLGSVAINIARGVAKDMIPSPPPGFATEASPPADHAQTHPEAWSQKLHHRGFAILFAVFFVHSLWAAFRRDRIGVEGRLRRITSKLREDWFGLIVGNAFSAWAAVLVLGFTQNFSLVHIVWQAISGEVLPVVVETTRFLVGEANTASAGEWISWYNANDAKLTFWIIYLFGALDDLGVPNFKSLARWGWRKWRNPQPKTLPVPDSQAK